MARDATTGELVWAYNIVPADPWDLDQPLITPLIDVEVNGTMRQAAVKAARNGWLYLWDRNTGELIVEPWMFEYNDITKGVDMATGRPTYDVEKWMFTHVEDRRKYTDADPLKDAGLENYTGTEVPYCPGTAARNWENDAWSPLTKLLYTSTDTNCGVQIVVEGEYVPGENYTLRQTVAGAEVPRLGLDGQPTTVLSKLQANDPVGRKNVWTNDWNTDRRVPVMATAGGLVFQGGNDKGVFRAMNAETGEVVWQFRTGSQFNQTPITYLHEGKQYIAIISSNRMGDAAVGFDAPADAALRYGRQGTTLYVFALPG
jgi:glucose dehydrogenase